MPRRGRRPWPPSATIELVPARRYPRDRRSQRSPVRSPLVEQAREALDGYGIQTAPVVLHQRVDHVHAYTRGLTATEYTLRGKAAAELRQLFAWLIQGEFDVGDNT